MLIQQLGDPPETRFNSFPLADLLPLYVPFKTQHSYLTANEMSGDSVLYVQEMGHSEEVLLGGKTLSRLGLPRLQGLQQRVMFHNLTHFDSR